MAYSEDWADVAREVKNKSGWKCECCGHPDDVTVGRQLSVHHINGDETDNSIENLIATCQHCHLRLQSKVIQGSRNNTRSSLLEDCEVRRRQQTFF